MCNINIFEIVKYVDEKIRTIVNTIWKMKRLKRRMEELTTMRDDVNRIVNEQLQTQPGTRRKLTVGRWLRLVDGIQKDVRDLLGQTSCCTSCCTYCCGEEEVLQLITEVVSLSNDGDRYLDGSISLVEPIPIIPPIPDDDIITFLGSSMDTLRNIRQTLTGFITSIVMRSWCDDVSRIEEEVHAILRSVAEETSNGAERVAQLIGSIQSLLEEGRNYIDDNDLVQPIPISPTDNHKRNLERKMEELKNLRQDVNKIIHEQEREQSGTECKVVVRSWLDAVNRKSEEVNAILDSVAESSSWPEYVADLLDSIQPLVEKGRRYLDGDMVLVQPIPIDPIDSVPDLSRPMVGRDLKLSEITDSLKGDSQVQTIGILGMGGIGKTTLLKSIKYELSKNHDFFYIVWIEIPSQNVVEIVNIQKQIASCICLPFKPEQDESERARILRNVLRRKKSLILIDDVWKKLDYEKIGIPFGVHIDNVKIVFTTRSERVCTDMRAQKIVKLDCLHEEDSLQLFLNNINSNVNATYQIRQRIDEILEKCGGLPLAIITVARVLANYTLVEEWDDAVECLWSSPAEIEGMDDLMRCLKFSYYKLENDELQLCLLYFSLYPRGSNIPTDELIKNWIGEGFLDVPNNNSFKESYERGHQFIKTLKSICLVESGNKDDYVKVQYVVRDMLSFIREAEKREVFLVYDDDESNIGYNHWNLAKGINLNVDQLSCLPKNGMPSCPNLTSLIVEPVYYLNPIVKFPSDDFFHFTPSLRVLNLSHTWLKNIPKSIGELVELRHLNLCGSTIKMLPMELGNLKMLKCLDLGETLLLETIVGIAISQLSLLQSLNLYYTGYQWNSDIDKPLLMLEDLRELKNLEDLGMDVSSNSQLNTFFGNQILLKSIKRISFIRIDFAKDELQLTKLISERFPQLQELVVNRCVLPGNILEIKEDHKLLVENLSLLKLEIWSVIITKDSCHPFHGLKLLRISNCQCLKEVSWTAHMPSLKELYVSQCNGVEELVATGEEEIEEERECYFPKLSHLSIFNLENLHSIHGRSRPLLFPALKQLFIENCSKLKQLSLGHDSAKEIQIIRCEQHQWDSLEWEDDQVRDRFLPYFRALNIKYQITCKK